MNKTIREMMAVLMNNFDMDELEAYESAKHYYVLGYRKIVVTP